MLNPDECVAFKQEYGNTLLVEQTGVSIRPSDDKIMSFNIKAPKDRIQEVEEFFKGFQMAEPVLIDIANTGNIHCYFKGISPILNKGDYHFISVTVQELKQQVVEEEQEIGVAAHECVGCGLHDFH